MKRLIKKKIAVKEKVANLNIKLHQDNKNNKKTKFVK